MYPESTFVRDTLTSGSKKYNFKVNDNGWINWPDFQGRVYKNNGTLKWSKGLHETVTGSEKTIGLQNNPTLALWHIKSIQKARIPRYVL